MAAFGNILGRLLGKQYTLGELMNVDQGRAERSKDIRVSLVKVYHELEKESIIDKFKSMFTGKTGLLMYYLIFKFEATSGTSGNKHTVFIRLSPDFDLNQWQQNKVKVYCDCKDFQFRSAYMLKKNNTLFLTDRIKIALGQALTTAPKEKTKTTTLCKHVVACVQYLIKNYGNIMKTI